MTKPWWKAKPERTGSKLRLRLKLKKGCLVRGRSNELFEAVVNLIKNAAEDLPQGGTIQISSAIQGDRVVLHVSDMSHEFDGNKPHRGPSATRNKPLNAKGIELVVTYGIVTRHGGTISTEPVNGAGTSFTVSLPLSKEPAPAARSAPDTSPSVNLRILLIDDFQPLVAMLGDGLAAYDHTISTALSGREGLAVLKENPIDLVICDLGMPDMNGWQVAREVLSFCAEERRAKIPFILLTGWAGQINVIDRIKECAVDRVLAKPVDVPQLLETIREVMSDAGHSCEPD
jgi:CheY-like chemotaxis protein